MEAGVFGFCEASGQDHRQGGCLRGPEGTPLQLRQLRNLGPPQTDP